MAGGCGSKNGFSTGWQHGTRRRSTSWAGHGATGRVSASPPCSPEAPGRADPGPSRRPVPPGVPDPDAAAPAEPTDPTVRRTLSALDRVTAELPGGETPRRPARDGRGGRRRGHRRPPPRRPGRHRHRQVARLPRARHPRRPQHGRRHRHQGPAGPARRQGPALPGGAPRHRRSTFAVLKGRSNYVCRQRLREIASGGDEQLELDGRGRAAPAAAEIAALARVGRRQPPTGDRAELAVEPSPPAWAARQRRRAASAPAPADARRATTASPRRPGAAAAEATSSSSTPTCTACTWPAAGVLLPEHDVVVFDEAHAAGGHRRRPPPGSSSAPAASPTLARAHRGDRRRQPTADGRRRRWPARWRPALGRRAGDGCRGGARRGARRRWSPWPSSGSTARWPALRAMPTPAPATTPAPASSGRMQAAGVARRRHRPPCSTGADRRALGRGARRTARRCGSRPLDVGALLAEPLWPNVTAVLTSATIPPALLDHAVGLPAERLRRPRRRQPLRLRAAGAALLRGPPPRSAPAGFDAAVHDELEALIDAAGGRTLALFTSCRAMDAAAEALAAAAAVPMLTQDDLPKPALLAAFTADEPTCLFATMGFWQGVDVPGRVADRSSPSTGCRSPGPTTRCCRPAASGPASRRVPHGRPAPGGHAAGPGRRAADPLDRPTAASSPCSTPGSPPTKSYRWDIVRALPPMRRTRDRAEAEQFLEFLRS